MYIRPDPISPAPAPGAGSGVRSLLGGVRANPTPRVGGMYGTAQPNSFKKGGKVRKTGMALVHKGEEVIPKKSVEAAKKTKKPKKMSKKNAKIKLVMGEFKRGDLKSPSGGKVTDRKQALAIAMSESDKV